jgi:mono/diheme cytochrome c family protein
MGTVAFSVGTRAAMGGTPIAIAQDTLRTTQSGVFTEDQANRGKQTFASICGSCHTPSSESGDAFDSKWKDHPLSDLFTYIGTQMPQSDPGSLDPGVTIDVVAYMLKLNEMPSGTTELTPDTVALKTIRITRLKGPTP